MKWIPLFALLIINLVSCQSTTQMGYKNAPIAQLSKIQKENKAIVIDVRTPAEWQEGVIEGATVFIDYKGGNF